MFIIGIIFIIISFFILYKRLYLKIFGKKAVGKIIGYTGCTRGTHGIVAYNYKIKFCYDGRDYVAKSLESVSAPIGNVPNKNLNKEVSVYFNINNPELVTIKESDSAAIIAAALFIFGIITFFI